MTSTKLLVLNAGSSSLKFKVFGAGSGQSLSALASGLCERVGDASKSSMKASVMDHTRIPSMPSPTVVHEPLQNHATALSLVSEFLRNHFGSDFTTEVRAVGHRVVHGLTINEPVMITPEVRDTIERASNLAPLHNPANLQGIDAAMRIFPAAAQVAVFDTAFHQTMAPEAFMYALPYELYEQKAVRRYGFHGTSYNYLTRRTAFALGKPASQVNAVIMHLGAGASMCAVQLGRSIDTTMGLTPLEGLMMGSRCGDIDPAIVTWLQSSAGMTAAEVDTMMNKSSGFYGMAGNVDLRSVLEGASKGNARCSLAVAVFVRRVRKYLGAYWMLLSGNVDAIVFSGGIGEHAAEIRRRVCAGMAWAGVRLDEERNVGAAVGPNEATEVQADDSRVTILVIPTDEELSIAEQTLEVVAGG